MNEIHTIIAESYARIFRQNMFNCGMLAIELTKEQIDVLIALAGDGEVSVEVDLPGQKVVAETNGKREEFKFEISQFDKALVEAGGWVEFADARY